MGSWSKQRGPPAKTADGLSNQQKGVIGEEAAENTMLRAGYTKYEGIDPKLNNSDHGFDGVWVKKDSNGNVSEIVITESKYSSSGNPKLHNTNMGQQMSDSWIDGNIKKLIESPDVKLQKLGNFLNVNSGKIEFIKKNQRYWS